MSNEFEVHNFYNYTIEELKELKDQFRYLVDSAINYKKSLEDLDTIETHKEWLKKWEDLVDDDQAFDLAREHYKES